MSIEQGLINLCAEGSSSACIRYASGGSIDLIWYADISMFIFLSLMVMTELYAVYGQHINTGDLGARVPRFYTAGYKVTLLGLYFVLIVIPVLDLVLTNFNVLNDFKFIQSVSWLTHFALLSN